MDIDAFILIGGRSSRFGTDKAFYEIEGEPLALRASRTIRKAFPGISISFVASSEDQFGIKTDVLDGPLVFDIKKGVGAWSGLHAALHHSQADWTLVLACDLPFVTSQILRELADIRASDIDAVVPNQDERGLQPLCAIYRTEPSLRIVNESLTDEKAPPLQSLFKLLRTSILDVEENALRNVNTPADLE